MVMGYFAQSVTYPLSVTSTIMATNGANLKAGNPPFTSLYESSLACLRDLLKSVSVFVYVTLLVAMLTTFKALFPDPVLLKHSFAVLHWFSNFISEDPIGWFKLMVHICQVSLASFSVLISLFLV